VLLLPPVPPQEKKPAAFGWNAVSPQAIFNAVPHAALLSLLLLSLLQEKKPAAFGWDAFNPQAIFNAAERRAAKIQPDLEQYRSVTGSVTDTESGCATVVSRSDSSNMQQQPAAPVSCVAVLSWCPVVVQV
jgi:hypothetical protein